MRANVRPSVWSRTSPRGRGRRSIRGAGRIARRPPRSPELGVRGGVPARGHCLSGSTHKRYTGLGWRPERVYDCSFARWISRCARSLGSIGEGTRPDEGLFAGHTAFAHADGAPERESLNMTVGIELGRGIGAPPSRFGKTPCVLCMIRYHRLRQHMPQVVSRHPCLLVEKSTQHPLLDFISLYFTACCWLLLKIEPRAKPHAPQLTANAKPEDEGFNARPMRVESELAEPVRLYIL